MALFEINRTPSDRVLRQFGTIAAIALPTLVWVTTHNAIAITVGGLLGAAALATWPKPQLLKKPFVALSLATAPLGMVLGEALLLAMYFGVFLPIGLLFKLVGRDPLARTFDRSAESYWVPKRTSPDAAAYLRQF